jgi:hypothetical protein
MSVQDIIARAIRGGISQTHVAPFGGLQLILCGDFLQLPPVEAGGDGVFCFESPLWAQSGLMRGTVVLQQIHRQSGDPAFVELLNQVRRGECTMRTLATLARCLVTKKAAPSDGILATRLYCTNRDVDAENNQRLAELRSRPVTFDCQDETEKCDSVTQTKFKEIMERRIAARLTLKVGAQVILLRNLSERLANGSRGIVVAINSNPDSNSAAAAAAAGPFAAFRAQKKSSEPDKQLQPKEGVQVRFDNGDLVLVERAEFTQSGSPEFLVPTVSRQAAAVLASYRSFCCPLTESIGWLLCVWRRQRRRQAHALANTAQAGLGADRAPRAGHDAVARRADARGGVRVRAGLRGAQPRHRAARALDAIAVCHLFLCDA